MNKKLEKPIISCIMPVYNTENSLQKTIDSLLGQEFENFELICVNDASTDRSISILEQLSRKDNRIIILDKKINEGAAKCRNRGLKLAKGEYVIFLDSDDYFYPYMLREAYLLMVKNNADVVTFGFCQKTIDEETEKIVSIREYRFPNMVLEGKSKNESPLLLDYLAPWNKLVKKTLLTDNKIEFQNLPNCNDVYYSLATMYTAEKVVFSEKILVDYMFGRKGCLSNSREKKQTYLVSALDKAYKFLVCKNIEPMAMDKYLHYVMMQIINLTDYQEESRKFTLELLQESCIFLRLIQYAEKKNVVLHKLLLGDVSRNQLRKLEEYLVDVAEFVVKDAVANGKCIALWGCGERGRWIIDGLNERGQSFGYVIDQSELVRKQGYGGHLIHTYDEVKDEIEIVVVSSYAVERDVKSLANDKIVLNLFEY